ncbi:hypothetical protein NPIL_212391 [Nephila pilipes]|uniref:Uncharacterized protein n=1 Tax=Nephila pilipes TaxID=299642 RepID=A0A8X6PM68_NEPPI|nr:hypothetical protein NPIL_212391 [Nephila pilipes]
MELLDFEYGNGKQFLPIGFAKNYTTTFCLPPAMHIKEVCDTRRMLEQRLDILRAQHDEAYAYLCHIEEKFLYTTSEFYQGAYAMYKSAEQARTKAEGKYDLFPYCPIPGCPYHSKLPKSPNKNNKQKRTDEEG